MWNGKCRRNDDCGFWRTDQFDWNWFCTMHVPIQSQFSKYLTQLNEGIFLKILKDYTTLFESTLNFVLVQGKILINN